MGWIDIHTHLNMLDMSPEEALTLAKASGVERVITIGTEPKDHQLVLDLARKFHPDVHCTLGVHPHEASLYTDEVEAFITAHASEPHVVAIGEIGLDYYYNHSPREPQREAFRRQLDLAVKLDLPVEIHTREAESETVEILGEFGGRVRGLLHCFTGTRWLAEKALDLGLNISFSGIVTFKNADELRAIVSYVPHDRMHVETDAPFLAPVPHRGKKNQPAWVSDVGRFVAGLKNISAEELERQTSANARAMFGKLAW